MKKIANECKAACDDACVPGLWHGRNGTSVDLVGADAKVRFSGASGEVAEARPSCEA